MIQRFPTRRHGPVLRAIKGAFHFYERNSMAALWIVVGAALAVMLLGRVL